MAKKDIIAQQVSGSIGDLTFSDTSVIAGGKEYKHLPASSIKASPFNEGMPMDEEVLKAYAQSMETTGLLQPIIVYDLGDGTYEILSGHQRFNAWCKILGHETIPSVVKAFEPDIQKRFMAHTEANTQNRKQDGRFWCSVLKNARKVLALSNPDISKAQEIDLLSSMLHIGRSQIYRYDNFSKLSSSLQLLEAQGVLSVRKALLASDLSYEEQNLVADKVVSLLKEKPDAADDTGEISAQEFQSVIDTVKGVNPKAKSSPNHLSFSEKTAKASKGFLRIIKTSKTESEKEMALRAISELRKELDAIESELRRD